METGKLGNWKSLEVVGEVRPHGTWMPSTRSVQLLAVKSPRASFDAGGREVELVAGDNRLLGTIQLSTLPR